MKKDSESPFPEHITVTQSGATGFYFRNCITLFQVTISLTKTAYFFPDKSQYAVARGCMRMYSFKKYTFFDIIGPGMTDLCSFPFSDNHFFLFCLLSEAVSDLSKRGHI